MNLEQRDSVKKKIIRSHELYLKQNSRLKRLLGNPTRFLMNAAGHLKPYKVRYKTFWGDTMHFYLPEGNAIYYYGFFEANLTNFFLNFLQEGDIFFDIGAHVGYYSILSSNLVGETGSVHSFEPTPRTFASLRENTSGKSNVTVNNNAALDKETEIEFADYGPKYSAFNSFKNRAGGEMKFLGKPQKIRVKTVSIDKYCSEKNIKPTLIKIDAEGAESLILKSMDNLLRTVLPIVTIEVAGGDEWKENCHKSISLLKGYGYEMYEISLDGLLSKHTEKDAYSYDNLVFIHPKNLEKVGSLTQP